MRMSSRLFIFAWLCLLSVSFSFGVFAQSGRKQKKAETQPPPQGVNQPDKRVSNNDFGGAATSSSTDPEAEEKDGKPKLQAIKKRLIVMSAMPDMNVSLYFSDIARQGLLSEARRLVPTLQLSDSGSNQNRSDAMKAAKESDDAYVVLLEIESMSGSGMINGLDLRFTLYEPKTGKQIAFGSGYPQQPSAGGVGLPPIGGSRTDIRMDWAARDVARQVIGKMNLRPGF
ncbi:MAG: hypothetical protein HOP19_07970 [Acidobacteria bacterium]|nr:hypothetical protein [Acidobacteriota bacterium]